jgi:hypothetical protein
MNAIRIARKFKVDEKDASALIESGLDTPTKIKQANSAKLKKALGKDKLPGFLGK